MNRMIEPAQSIEELKERFDSLSTEKVRLQTQKERAEKDLEELKKQSVDQFGTDDLKKLQTMLSDMKKKNEQQKSEYQRQLDEIDGKLLKIDESFEVEDVELQ